MQLPSENVSEGRNQTQAVSCCQSPILQHREYFTMTYLTERLEDVQVDNVHLFPSV